MTDLNFYQTISIISTIFFVITYVRWWLMTSDIKAIRKSLSKQPTVNTEKSNGFEEPTKNTPSNVTIIEELRVEKSLLH